MLKLSWNIFLEVFFGGEANTSNVFRPNNIQLSKYWDYLEKKAQSFDKGHAITF